MGFHNKRGGETVYIPGLKFEEQYAYAENKVQSSLEILQTKLQEILGKEVGKFFSEETKNKQVKDLQERIANLKKTL